MYDYAVDKNSPDYKGAFNNLACVARVFTPEDKTIITPNSDNINDEFIIRFVEDYEDLSRVNIFNRWGDRVWQSEPLYDNSTPWRGTNQNGAKLADGVYFYTIELLNTADNYEYVVTGSVTILDAQ